MFTGRCYAILTGRRYVIFIGRYYVTFTGRRYAMFTGRYYVTFTGRRYAMFTGRCYVLFTGRRYAMFTGRCYVLFTGRTMPCSLGVAMSCSPDVVMSCSLVFELLSRTLPCNNSFVIYEDVGYPLHVDWYPDSCHVPYKIIELTRYTCKCRVATRYWFTRNVVTYALSSLSRLACYAWGCQAPALHRLLPWLSSSRATLQGHDLPVVHEDVGGSHSADWYLGCCHILYMVTTYLLYVRMSGIHTASMREWLVHSTRNVVTCNVTTYLLWGDSKRVIDFPWIFFFFCLQCGV